jgi:hypothetical protein
MSLAHAMTSEYDVWSVSLAPVEPHVDTAELILQHRSIQFGTMSGPALGSTAQSAAARSASGDCCHSSKATNVLKIVANIK